MDSHSSSPSYTPIDKAKWVQLNGKTLQVLYFWRSDDCLITCYCLKRDDCLTTAWQKPMTLQQHYDCLMTVWQLSEVLPLLSDYFFATRLNGRQQQDSKTTSVRLEINTPNLKMQNWLILLIFSGTYKLASTTLFVNSLTTAWWLPDDFLMTGWQLPNNCLATERQLLDKCFG